MKGVIMIYTITTLKTVHGYRNPAHTYELGLRTVGYYKDLKVAQEEVEHNSCDIYENGYYPFCVIEETEEGIYQYGKNYWYQWIGNQKEGGYQAIKKPETLKQVCGFGMG